MRLHVCTHQRLGGAASCGGRGGKALHDGLRALGLPVDTTPCLGQCEHGPNVKILPAGDLLRGASVESVAAHFAGKDIPA